MAEETEDLKFGLGDVVLICRDNDPWNDMLGVVIGYEPKSRQFMVCTELSVDVEEDTYAADELTLVERSGFRALKRNAEVER